MVTTGVYLKVLHAGHLRRSPENLAAIADLDRRQLLSVAPLAVASLAIGLLPFWLLRVIEGGTRLLAGG